MRFFFTKHSSQFAWTAFLMVVLALPIAKAVLPAPIVERSSEEDFRSLVGDPPEEALRRYQGLSWIYMEKSPPRPDLVLESASWVARNPALPAYFEERIEQYPVLIENADDRGALIQTLRRFPAEWAVRILVKLYLADEPIRSERYDLRDPKIVELVAPTWDVSPDTQTNQYFARNSMFDMHLSGWLEERLKQKTDEPWGDFEKRVRQHQFNWIYSNQNRIPEVVKKTWGEKGVLNAELGLGPDNLPIKSGPAASLTSAPERIHPRVVTAKQQQESQDNQRSRQWIWIGVTTFLVGIGINILRQKIKNNNRHG